MNEEYRIYRVLIGAKSTTRRQLDIKYDRTEALEYAQLQYDKLPETDWSRGIRSCIDVLDSDGNLIQNFPYVT